MEEKNSPVFVKVASNVMSEKKAAPSVEGAGLFIPRLPDSWKRTKLIDFKLKLEDMMPEKVGIDKCLLTLISGADGDQLYITAVLGRPTKIKMVISQTARS